MRCAFHSPAIPTMKHLEGRLSPHLPHNWIKTAVAEVVKNFFLLAYLDTIWIIYITAKYDDHGTLQIKIRDKGCGIADVEQAMQPLFTTAGEERAGLGFAVMESFMDKLRVTSKLGSGTTVTMQKNLARRVMKNG